MKKILYLLIVMLFLVNSINAANYVTCENAMQKKKPFILYLHSNTCYACKQFTPLFTKIMDSFPSYDIVDINYSYPQPKNVCSSAESRTIPAVYVVNPQKRTRTKLNYSTYYDQDAFKSSLNALLNQ